jgi:ABC-type antimicrobial peptide transport system permease subunit
MTTGGLFRDLRLTLGAPRRRVLGEVVGHGVKVTFQGFLFGVAPTDPTIFPATRIVVAGVALLASCLPARRAIRVDPVVALRSE